MTRHALATEPFAMTGPLLSRGERLKQGKALRQRVPREAHGEIHGPKDRDPVAILAEGDATRVPELIGERYARMSDNPFAFLRGAAAVMAHDLAHEPMVGATVQACGDCHLMNFGAFNTPEDNILFDINDFDETLPGVDFTVDLKRLAASVAVAARSANMRKKHARLLAAQTVKAYRDRMAALATLSPLEIWHGRVDLEAELKVIEDRALRRKLASIIAKARGFGIDRDDNFPHLVTGETAKIADKPPAIFHLDDGADSQHAFHAAQAFALYRESLTPDRSGLLDRYELKDLAFKAVGVGSVGTFCCVGLFLSGDGLPLFLQVKEAQRSVLEVIAPGLAYPGPQGRRVVEGQRGLQAASDIFLGWTTDEATKRQFYVRILKNRRLGGISELSEAEALSDYAKLCGRTLARAHARSGDPAIISGYMGKGSVLDDAIASFAMAYAELTVSDHAALVAAHASPKPPAGKPALAKSKVRKKAGTKG